MVCILAGAWFIGTEQNLMAGDFKHYIQHKTNTITITNPNRLTLKLSARVKIPGISWKQWHKSHNAFQCVLGTA